MQELWEPLHPGTKNDAETMIYLSYLLAANPEEEESQRAEIFPEQPPDPDPHACRRYQTDLNNHTRVKTD
ncbi:hypothetical protein HID58_082000 [Brassica napus]|uniref:Uncharacterized protein n=1 Tax=Brassica napus TaxID=3708 RepID=A0ABQ7Y9C1_BRANA|nr:hypothetical protein HID58_082000 [Brassica napus]